MSFLTRAFLAGVLGLGVMAGLIRAQEPVPAPRPVPNGTPVPQYQPIAEYPAVPHQHPPAGQPDGFYGGEAGQLAPSPADAPARRRPLHDWWRRRTGSLYGVGCWSHHNSLRCGSGRADLTFIFGSCRAFYGERCCAEPPPNVLPPAYVHSHYGPGGYAPSHFAPGSYASPGNTPGFVPGPAYGTGAANGAAGCRCP